MKRITFVLPLFLALLCPLLMSEKKKEDTKHIVFIAGNRSHGPGEHEFYAGCTLLAKALNEQSGLKVKATVLRADWPKEHKPIVESADTIVIYADHVSAHAGQWEFLDGLAKKGVGMVFMHYAVHPNKQIGEKYYRPWIGGAMESGWSVNPHWVADLEIIKDHEIGNGVPEKITCLDEWYYHMRFVKERDKVLDLFTAVPTRDNMHRYINMWNKNGVEGLGKSQTLMWGYERPTGGRGVGFVGGHYHHSWAVDGLRRAVLNAIIWTAGMKVPQEGVQSRTPTEEELNVNLDKKGRVRRIKVPDPAAWKKLPPAKIQKEREAGFNQGAGAKVRPAPAPQEKSPEAPKLSKRSGAHSEDPARQPEGVPGKDLRAPGPLPVADGGIIVPDDLELSVWATGPALFNPANMDTDAAGRIWVAEGGRQHRNQRPEGARIVVLEDKDRDGRADSSHVFVQDPELVAPPRVSVFDNRVVVSQPPHLIVYTDVNRDLVFNPEVDKRENLLSGFNGKDHDHGLLAVVGGPDGKWYFSQDNSGAQFRDKDGVEFLIGGPLGGEGDRWAADPRTLAGKPSGDGRTWVGGFAARMNPDGTQVRIMGHGFRNSRGQTITSFGDIFQNDSADSESCRLTWMMEGGFFGFFSPDGQRTWQTDQRPGQTVAEAHWRQWDPGTIPPGDVYGPGSPTGICFYENGALPGRYSGLLASCDADRGVVLGYFPIQEESNFKLERFDFIKTQAGNPFRPSDIMVGADGALYLSGWVDRGAENGPAGDQNSPGIIYRLAPKGFRPAIRASSADSIEEAITLLSSPAQNVRHLGFEALQAAGEKALPAVRSLLGHYNGYLQARAVWLLPDLGAEGLRLTRTLLDSPDARTRLLAFRSLRNAGEDPLEMVSKFYVDEPSSAVRSEVALSLRDVPAQRKSTYLSYFLRRCSAGDRTYLEACGLAAEGAEELVWARLKSVARITQALEWTEAFARITWRLHPGAAIPDLQKRALAGDLSDAARLLAVETLAFTDDPAARDALIEIAKAKGPTGKEALRWLLHLAETRWKDFDIFTLLSEHGLLDLEN
ncbi:MAG: ThuA domain-containing protein [Roseibacillus sp.]|nr:ThuA domain-containing protein [Roseibacillus sp.]